MVFPIQNRLAVAAVRTTARVQEFYAVEVLQSFFWILGAFISPFHIQQSSLLLHLAYLLQRVTVKSNRYFGWLVCSLSFIVLKFPPTFQVQDFSGAELWSSGDPKTGFLRLRSINFFFRMRPLWLTVPRYGPRWNAEPSPIAHLRNLAPCATLPYHHSHPETQPKRG